MGLGALRGMLALSILLFTTACAVRPGARDAERAAPPGSPAAALAVAIDTLSGALDPTATVAATVREILASPALVGRRVRITGSCPSGTQARLLDAPRTASAAGSWRPMASRSTSPARSLTAA